MLAQVSKDELVPWANVNAHPMSQVVYERDPVAWREVRAAGAFFAALDYSVLLLNLLRSRALSRKHSTNTPSGRSLIRSQGKHTRASRSPCRLALICCAAFVLMCCAAFVPSQLSIQVQGDLDLGRTPAGKHSTHWPATHRPCIASRPCASPLTYASHPRPSIASLPTHHLSTPSHRSHRASRPLSRLLHVCSLKCALTLRAARAD